MHLLFKQSRAHIWFAQPKVKYATIQNYELTFNIFYIVTQNHNKCAMKIGTRKLWWQKRKWVYLLKKKVVHCIVSCMIYILRYTFKKISLKAYDKDHYKMRQRNERWRTIIYARKVHKCKCAKMKGRKTTISFWIHRFAMIVSAGGCETSSHLCVLFSHFFRTLLHIHSFILSVSSNCAKYLCIISILKFLIANWINRFRYFI